MLFRSIRVRHRERSGPDGHWNCTSGTTGPWIGVAYLHAYRKLIRPRVDVIAVEPDHVPGRLGDRQCRFGRSGAGDEQHQCRQREAEERMETDRKGAITGGKPIQLKTPPRARWSSALRIKTFGDTGRLRIRLGTRHTNAGQEMAQPSGRQVLIDDAFHPDVELMATDSYVRPQEVNNFVSPGHPRDLPRAAAMECA